ncbi:MAG: imidazole glycerol phosphate synthase subunit HisH [Planctomycetes bacterium]|nr:imidazole glycerol phosphate synthase subunit HisH [Planctomycetota bacterium]
MTVAVIDSGICNLASIARALEREGGAVAIATTAAAVAKADRLVLPGVGSFPAGMKALHERGLVECIHTHVRKGRPLLGICLGMQLLFETGEEFGHTAGLGLIAGQVREINAHGLAVPHMGWNRLEPTRDDALLRGLPDEAFFYFVHSFVCVPSEAASVLAQTDYGERFCSAVRQGNVWGLQAHPEKSQNCGALLLRNFLSLSA